MSLLDIENTRENTMFPVLTKREIHERNEKLRTQYITEAIEELYKIYYKCLIEANQTIMKEKLDKMNQFYGNQQKAMDRMCE